MKEPKELYSIYIESFSNFLNSLFPGLSCIILPCVFKILEASWENKMDSQKKKKILNQCCLIYETYLQDHCVPIFVKDRLPCLATKQCDGETINTTCSTSGSTECTTLFSKYRVECARHQINPWYVFRKEQQIIQVDVFHHKVLQKLCIPQTLGHALLESSSSRQLCDALEKKCYESFLYPHYKSNLPNARCSCSVNTDTEVSLTMNNNGVLQQCLSKKPCDENVLLQTLYIVVSLELVKVLNFWSAVKSCRWKVEWDVGKINENRLLCQLYGHLTLKLSYFENGKIFATHSNECARSLEFAFPMDIERIVEDIIKCIIEEHYIFFHKIEQFYKALHTHVLKHVKRVVAFHQRKFDWKQPNDTIPYNVMCHLLKK